MRRPAVGRSHRVPPVLLGRRSRAASSKVKAIDHVKPVPYSKDLNSVREGRFTTGDRTSESKVYGSVVPRASWFVSGLSVGLK